MLKTPSAVTGYTVILPSQGAANSDPLTGKGLSSGLTFLEKKALKDLYFASWKSSILMQLRLMKPRIKTLDTPLSAIAPANLDTLGFTTQPNNNRPGIVLYKKRALLL
jgi:hypothetical protein